MIHRNKSIAKMTGHSKYLNRNQALIQCKGHMTIELYQLQGIVKWGKEQPKITNLALTPQPQLLEMKVICQLTGATSENHL